ncbi:MAG: hypothetical protein WBW00_02625 [Pseudolabrys sp.]|jgi:hypothetical protein
MKEAALVGGLFHFPALGGVLTLAIMIWMAIAGKAIALRTSLM